MVEFLKNWVVNLIILAIFMVLLEIIVPSGKIKKFITLTSGFILIIAIINPFLGLFYKGMDMKEFMVSSSSFIDKREIQENSKVFQEKQMKQVTEVYRDKLIRQIEECVGQMEGISSVKADVIINEDYKSADFGAIKRVYVFLKPGEGARSIKPVAGIEKIKIDGKNKENNQKKEVDAGIKSQVEEKIKNTFEVSKENIVISAM
ncbi:MAG: stage III sporulation protein AF [Clostridiales bacterium]|jgi:stage III sporulation protein AF|nr:stage III sporulation protein AF [Eubacteriales bacterium]MDH7565238.1 stage III sporulation protein AF [Clostridiales bacterium]